jgi:hypothetical protein
MYNGGHSIWHDAGCFITQALIHMKPARSNDYS